MPKERTQEIDNVLNLYKERSETPLQTIQRYVARHPEYGGSRMTYAGRLDPMAEGVLVVLSGEMNKKREEYTGLDKDYEFEFVFGLDTDTHDLLGMITKTRGGNAAEKEVIELIRGMQGTFMQKYPAYSSKVVNGTPLFELARKGKIDIASLPEHEVTIFQMEYMGFRRISKDEFQAFIDKTIGALRGDFRQKQILESWKSYFQGAPHEYVVFKARVTCGSGFYVRQLVSDMGEKLGRGAVTVSILRTRVGGYSIKDSQR